VAKLWQVGQALSAAMFLDSRAKKMEGASSSVLHSHSFAKKYRKTIVTVANIPFDAEAKK
jgi:hypothetical protein